MFIKCQTKLIKQIGHLTFKIPQSFDTLMVFHCYKNCLLLKLVTYYIIFRPFKVMNYFSTSISSS